MADVTQRLLACWQQAFNHELPNQMVAIQGLLSLLVQDARSQLGLEAREYLDRLAGATRRAHELVRALAEAGRAGRETTVPEPVELAEAAREAAATVNPLFPLARFEYHFATPAPVVHLERKGIVQVLVHLLRNAARASPPGASINVGGGPSEAGIAFWVTDVGRGLGTDELARLTEPFLSRWQPEASRGLGLFVVRQWVDHWGGRLGVESAPGKGSTFTIWIPQTPAWAAAANPGRRTPDPRS